MATIRTRAGVTLVLVAATIGAALSYPMSAGAKSAPPSQECSDPDQIVRGADGWEAIRAPEFSSGPQEITAYAVDPYDPDFMFVTNGAVVMRSSDAGCSFKEVFDLATSGDLLASQGSITSLEIPASRSAHDRVYALVAAPRGLGPRVLASWDHGRSWAASSDGLAPVGNPVELVVAESSPDTLYLLVNVGSFANVVYRSSDGGASWERPLPSNAANVLAKALDQAPTTFSDIAVDPRNPGVVWAASQSSAGLYRSRDGAATWQPIPLVGLMGGFVPVGVLDVFRARGAVHMVAFSSNGTEVFWSKDGGEAEMTWTQGVAPGVVESAARSKSDLVISLASESARVYRRRGSYIVWDRLRLLRRRPPFRDLSADRAANVSFYGRTSSALMRHGSRRGTRSL